MTDRMKSLWSIGVTKLQNRIVKTDIPEIYVTYEKARLDYKETISISIKDRNYSIDDLLQKVKKAMPSDMDFPKNHDKRLECIRWKSQKFFQNHLQLDTKSMIYEKPIHNLNITEQWSEFWNKGHKKVMKSFAD